MHLLFVSSLVPVESPASGFDIANRAVLDGLRALGHRVSVVGYLQPGQRPAPGGDTHLLGTLEVTNARVGAATKLRWLAAALANRTSLSSAKMLGVSKTRIDALLRELKPFDGIILNSVQLPAAFAESFVRYPTIYVAHNIEAASARENAAAASGGIESFLFAREARFLERYERQLTEAASCVWTFAEADRTGFGESVAQRASVLPLVTQWMLPKEPPPVPAQYDLGLIGTWSWKPNRLGLDWFLSKIVPRLPPGMSIAIAGKVPVVPPVVHPGVRFLGRVADASAFVRSAAVVPLISRGGTGVQLKTIETFELGMPSVATRASLRGIGVVPINCAVADDEETFARLLVERVAAARAGKLGRTSGLAFHHAQKTLLLGQMERDLESLAELAGSSCLDTRRRTALAPSRPAASSANPFRLAALEGGKSR